jgi:UDP-N-acetylmuramyl pentapeptide phosphotransferase/UDP-N-acetylglucosamine-1-phosphate transferase
MGGALIILALVAATLLWCDLRSAGVADLLVTVGRRGRLRHDYQDLKRNKRGLPGKIKLGAEFDGGFAIAWLFASDAFAPELRLHPSAAAVSFHHHSLCCRWR